jgi:hypothetical protein
MENMEKFKADGGEMSDEELLTPRNQGKKRRKDFTRAEAPFPGSTIGDNSSLIEALENLSIKPTPETLVTPPKEKIVMRPTNPSAKTTISSQKSADLSNVAEKAVPPVERPEQQKEDPETILDGINGETTIAGILDLVKKAYKNETTDEDRSYYTLILDTLQKIQKIASDSSGRISNELINKLSKKHNLRDTVTKILGLNNQIESAPTEVKDKPRKEVVNKEQASSLPEDNSETEYLKNRIDEARDFINKSADNMSVKALMNEFALDEKTAKSYLIKALGVKEEEKIGVEEADTIDTIKTALKGSLINNLKNKIERKTAEKEPDEDEVESIDLSDEQIANIKTSFDTPGFLEFLSKNPDTNFDISDTKNSEHILKIYEAFVSKEAVAKGVKSTISEEFNRVIGVGDTESLSSVDVYLNSQAYENPEAILEFKKQIYLLESGKLEIEHFQKQISEKTAELPLGKTTTQEEADLELINTVADASFLGPVAKKIINQFANTGAMIETLTKRDETKEKIDLKDVIMGIGAGLKLFFVDIPYTLYQLTRIRSKENSEARNSAREKIEKITGEKYSHKAVGKYAEKILLQKERSTEIGKIEKDLQGGTAVYEISKSLIARELINKTGAIEDAKTKIKTTIGEILSSKTTDLNSTEKAQTLLEKVEETMIVSSGSEFSLDFLSEGDKKELQDIINKKAQEVIFNEFTKAFKNSKGVNGKISAIESSLKSILEKSKVGSLEGKEKKTTMKEALVKVIEHYKDPIVTMRVKAFMLVNKL